MALSSRHVVRSLPKRYGHEQYLLSNDRTGRNKDPYWVVHWPNFLQLYLWGRMLRNEAGVAALNGLRASAADFCRP